MSHFSEGAQSAFSFVLLFGECQIICLRFPRFVFIIIFKWADEGWLQTGAANDYYYNSCKEIKPSQL